MSGHISGVLVWLAKRDPACRDGIRVPGMAILRWMVCLVEGVLVMHRSLSRLHLDLKVRTAAAVAARQARKRLTRAIHDGR